MSESTFLILLFVGITIFLRWGRLQSEKKNHNERKAYEQREREQERITELEERVESLEGQVEKQKRKVLLAKIEKEKHQNQFPKNVGQYYRNSLSVNIHLRGIGIKWKEISATILFDMYDGEQYQLAITRAKSLSKKEAISLIKKKIEYNKSLLIKEFAGNPKIQILQVRTIDSGTVYGAYLKCRGKNYRIPRNQDPELLNRSQCESIIRNSRSIGTQKSDKKDESNYLDR